MQLSLLPVAFPQASVGVSRSFGDPCAEPSCATSVRHRGHIRGTSEARGSYRNVGRVRHGPCSSRLRHRSDPSQVTL